MARVSMCAWCNKHQTKADGTNSLYIRIIINRKPKLIPLDKYPSIKADYFDFGTKKIKAIKAAPNHRQINRYIEDEIRKLRDIVLDLEKRDKSVSIENIKELYYSKKTDSFIDYAKSQIKIERYKLKQKTLDGYEYVIRKFEKYAPNATIQDITKEFLLGYEDYIINTLGHSRNTAFNDFKFIRKYMKAAFEDGIIKHYPFRKFTFSMDEETNRAYLEPEELDVLTRLYHSKELLSLKSKHNIPIGEKYQRVLFRFLIACYTGLRYSDMKTFNELLIKNNRTIELIPEKGTEGKRKWVRIPITSKLRELLNAAPKDAFSKSLPRTNVTSPHLRFIMNYAGINKDITFHCARHTFAITCLLLDIPLQVLKELLGHKEIRSTEIYGRIVDRIKIKEMAKWNKIDDILTAIPV